MKRLILVRHAKSNLNQPLVSDHNRILSESGRIDAKLIGQYLYNNNYFPSHIISSTATRTLQTLKIIIKEIHFKKDIEKQPLIYSDSTIDLYESFNSIYLPTRAIVVSFFGFLRFIKKLFHFFN